MRLPILPGILAGVTFAMVAIAPAPSRAAVTAPHAIDLGSAATLVSGGCGPEGFRAANGYCYPRRRPPPPPFYGRRPCPPGFHPTPYGCRRNF